MARRCPSRVATKQFRDHLREYGLGTHTHLPDPRSTWNVSAGTLVPLARRRCPENGPVATRGSRPKSQAHAMMA
jgi:hypothetical protein